MESIDSFRPTLFFTKLELVYLLVNLLKDISLYDDAKRIEMVECRHYLNLIKDKITAAAYDGSLKKTIAEVFGGVPEETTVMPTDTTQNNTPNDLLPSIEELKKQFPLLSQEEIEQILEERQKEMEKVCESRKKEEKPLPKFPKSIVQEPEAAMTNGEQTKQQQHNKECAKEFARLLGS